MAAPIWRRRPEEPMRLPPGLQTAEVTPTPTTGVDDDKSALVETVEVAWDRTVDLGNWLGGFALNLVWAGVVIFVVIFITGRLRRRVQQALSRRLDNNVPALVDNLLQIGVYVIAAGVALNALGANANALVSTIGLITAAVSLSLQDVLKNFVAGLYLLAEEPFAIGDRLEVAGQVGTVEQVNVRTTILRNDKAEQVLVPNYQVFSQVVSNRSAYRLRALTIAVAGVTGDPDDALAETASWLGDLPGLAQTPPTIEVAKVGPDGYDLAVIVWMPAGQDPRREVMRRLRARFPEATVSVAP